MRYVQFFGYFSSLLLVLACTKANNTDATSEESTAPDLESYLDENPSWKASLKIEQTYSAASYYYSGTPLELSYDDWSDEDKTALAEAFQRAWYYIYDLKDRSNTGTSDFTMPVECTDCTEQLSSNPSSKPIHRVTESVGKSVYFAYAAQSLALEIGGGLDWSIASIEDEELHHYFNSRSLMHRLGYQSTNFFIGSWTVSPSVPEKYLGDGSPATPIYNYNFLLNNNLIGDSHQETIFNLAEWFRDNVVHFYYGYERQNAYDHWQFAGHVPASRLIDGTVRTGESSSRHWTAGCHGTGAFFKTALKSINIPVEIQLVCNHAVLYFPSVGLYMDHGDDPYNANVRNQPEKSISGIFIDEATFTSRFGSDAHLTPGSDPSCSNIGKAAADF